MGPNDGWKLLPGTNDGRLFRCGEVIDFAHFDETSSSWVGGKVGGWWGNCVPAGVINNNEVNCGDNSDEGAASAICQWPFVSMIAPVPPSPTMVRPSTNKPTPKPTPTC